MNFSLNHVGKIFIDNNIIKLGICLFWLIIHLTIVNFLVRL